MIGIIGLLLLLPIVAGGQGLFDAAVSGASDDEDAAYELNGSVRGVSYVGVIPENTGGELKSVYGELTLKLRARPGSSGNAFAEIRHRRGMEFGESISEMTIREAYVNAYAGIFDIRFGHQIVVWGRADGFNPTDIITPRNMTIRSPDEDDRRTGNTLLRIHANIDPFRLEAVTLPLFAASVLPSGLVSLPEGIEMGTSDYPGENLNDMGFAMRLSGEWPSIDGSVSYFNGYYPMPGLGMRPIDGSASISVYQTAYRVHQIGADFSTTPGSFGIRSELAYRTPHKDHDTEISVPDPDIQIIFGGDREWGNLSLVLQYVGRIVFDYKDLIEPTDPREYSTYFIEEKNRMIASQQHEVSHGISFRPSLTLFHENGNAEILGLYNVTSEELYLKPKLNYDIDDNLTVTIGAEWYTGPESTLFGTIEDHVSGLFAELRAYF